jgi:hypothetical protein
MCWEDLDINDHAWALMNDELLVIIKDSLNTASVCGAWEGAISPRKLEIIAKIERPQGHEKTPLYYGEGF